MSCKVFNYQNGKIYKLCCKDPSITDIYIGSTLNQYQRKTNHKCNCNNSKLKSHNFYVYQFIRENGGFDNWNLIILEEYPAENKNDLLWKEREWVEKLKPTLNSCIPITTLDEKKEQHSECGKKDYEKNKEQMKKYKKENYEKNKEQRKEKRKEHYEKNKEHMNGKIECEICKVLVCRQYLTMHKKTQKHIKNLEKSKDK